MAAANFCSRPVHADIGGGHLWQLSHEKVCCSHPTLHRAERMLHRLTADNHCAGIVVEPMLNFLQNDLVLPA